MGSVTAIVLAAGASERMGAPKLSMPLGTGTILDATVAAVRAASVDRVVVVTAPGASTTAASDAVGEDRAVTVVTNADPGRGTMSSLRCGTDADHGAPAFIVVPGDQPTIATATIDAMVDLWSASAPWAAVTLYTDRIAHPFLVSRAAVDELGAVEGSKVLWHALVDPPNPRVVHLPVDGPAPIDVNTRADYAALVASWYGDDPPQVR